MVPGHCQRWLLSDLAIPGVHLGVIPTLLEAGCFFSLPQTCYYFYLPGSLRPFPLWGNPLLPSLSFPRLRRHALIFTCSFIQYVFTEHSVTSHILLWEHHGEQRRYGKIEEPLEFLILNCDVAFILDHEGGQAGVHIFKCPVILNVLIWPSQTPLVAHSSEQNRL